MNDRINPEHEVSQWAEDNWQKLVAMVMFQLGVTRIVVTDEDVERFGAAHPDSAVLVHARAAEGDLLIELITRAEAEQLAREA